MEREKISLDAVLNYELPIEKSSRAWRTAHLPEMQGRLPRDHAPPRVEGVCNHCGTKLEQREDDRPEAVKVRMEVYEKSTKPLIDFYRKRGLLVTIEAEGTPEEIYQRTLTALGSLRAG
jgi:adenylate kinase